MMGLDPMSIPYIRLAHEDGLGTGRVEEIDVQGEDISAVHFGFTVETTQPAGWETSCGSALRSLQRAVFRTPLVYPLIFGSYVYHDWLWWPLKGRRIQRTHALNTEWGDLFLRYPSDDPGCKDDSDEEDRRLLPMLAAALVLGWCRPGPGQDTLPAIDSAVITGRYTVPDGPQWLHKAVFYQIYPRPSWTPTGTASVT